MDLARRAIRGKRQRAIQRKLIQHLVPGGALLIGAHERLGAYSVRNYEKDGATINIRPFRERPAE